MSCNIIIQQEAIPGIQIAFEWYENLRKGLGFKFIEEIEASFQKISRTPNHYTFINKRYRRIKTSRFPYLIIYEVEGITVFVYNIVHAKQKKRKA